MPLVDPDLNSIRRQADYDAPYEGTPLISVCIYTYNRAQLLCERSLPSVLRQTYPHWEAIVVGDGCDDDTAERIAALGDARVRFIHRAANGPYPADPRKRWMVAGARGANEAASRARGLWIAVNNDDDEWSDDHLEVLLAEAQRTRAELVYGLMRVILHGTGEETTFGTWPAKIGDFAFQAAIFHAGLRGFRANLEAYKEGEPGDWNLARRLIEAGVHTAFIPEIVGTYHLAAGHLQENAWSYRVKKQALSDQYKQLLQDLAV